MTEILSRGQHATRAGTTYQMLGRRRAHLARIVLTLVIVLVMVFVVRQYRASMPQSAAASMSNPTIQVSPARASSTVSSIAFGVNDAVWDPHLQDASVPVLLSRAGARILRFPGGSTSDVYHWQTNSITPHQQGWAEPGNTFDSWMTNVVQPTGAQAMVTVNYGTNAAGTGGGDPSEAAAWVDYANNRMHDGVKYWEIGNEIYGNGYYGDAWKWETDLHPDKSPAAYATNLQAFSEAMKQADPSISIGASLIAPGIPPDGLGPENWNQTVLSRACGSIDFVSIHWYPQNPGAESDAKLLSASQKIPRMMDTLHRLIKRYCGSRASKIQIMVTETNSVSFNPGKQTTSGVSALFLAEDYLGWLQAGARNVDWWDLHDGPNPNGNLSANLFGTAPFGDFGLVSSGGTNEPPENKPFPSFSALRIISAAARPGSHFATIHTPTSSIRAFALLRSHTLAVILVNASGNRAARITVDARGVPRLLSARATTYDGLKLHKASATVPVKPAQLTYKLPAYTLAAITIRTA